MECNNMNIQPHSVCVSYSPQSTLPLTPRLKPLCAMVRLALTGMMLGAVSSSVVAQTPGDGNTPEIQEVLVTGSNILRAETDGTVPVSVIGEEAMEVRGALLPADLLTSLPSVVNLPENETRLGSSGARGDNANINMRNMGATATLVLVNGRRMAINPMTAGLSQAVNVNQLPTQGVQRIEVLRDGASSIYGSDAVGGVINYIMKREFDGVEMSFQQGGTQHGGGSNSRLAITFGSTDFADGRGRFIGTLEGMRRESIRLTDRDFSSTGYHSHRAPPPWNNPGGTFDRRSARGNWPTFQVGEDTANNYFYPVDGVPTLTSATPSRADDPDFFLDLAPLGFASPEVNRLNGFLAGEYDLTDRVSAFVEGGYYRADSTMQRQPPNLNAPTTDPVMVMPVDSPYNPYGSHFYHPSGEPNPDGSARLVGTPTTVGFTGFTPIGLDNETVSIESEVFRFSAGLKGDLGATWNWESSLFYNQVNGSDEASSNVRKSLLEAAIGRTDADAYNPFGYTFKVENGAVVADAPHTNNPQTVDSFAAIFGRSAESSIASADLRASGSLFSWWGGEVMTAVGVEHRREKLEDVRPPFSGENPPESGLDPLDNDFLQHPPRPDVFGDRDVTSLFTELMVPLIREDSRIPLAQRLELNLSARHERYSDFGNTTKPKVGLNWKPVDWMTLRASYNEGFMAPSLAALYTSPRWTSNAASAGNIDPYRNPALLEGPYPTRTDFGGNPDLEPQESRGTTAGFVIDMPFVDGLTVSADWWRIRRTNLLGTRSGGQINESDVALLRAYTEQQLAAGVPVDQIDLGSGTANYRGDPDVQRFPLTPEDIEAFAAYNAANPDNPVAAAGRIFSRNTPFMNLNSSEHSGVDFGFRYELLGLPFGDLVFNSEWAYLNKAETTIEPANVEPTTNNLLYSNGAARWRSTSNIFWRNGQWNAGLGIYHVGKTHDSATTSQAVYESLGEPSYIEPFYTQGRTVYRRVIDPYVTYNLSVGYAFDGSQMAMLRDTRLRVGILNLTDKEPPLAANNFGYDPGVSQSLMSGRSWTVQISRRF